MSKNTTRIATNKATGKRYIVIMMGEDKVHVYAEVKGFRGLRATVNGRKAFVSDAVTVQTVPTTPELLNGLFEQGLSEAREKGHAIRRTRGGNAIDYGTPLQRAEAMIFDWQLANGLDGIPLLGVKAAPSAAIVNKLVALAEEAERKGLNSEAERIIARAANLEEII